MIVGYARTSTLTQIAGLEVQERELRAAGVEKLFIEQVSATGPRKALDDLLEFVREGDVAIVTRPCRLARSVADLCAITSRLEKKGVALHIQSMGVNTSTPTGRLMVTLLGAISEFEKSLMLERQLAGIAKAKAEGKYRGRKPPAMAKRDDIVALVCSGLTREAAAKQLGIGVASVYRALKHSSSVCTQTVAAE